MAGLARRFRRRLDPSAPQSVIGVVVPCKAGLVRFTLPDRILAAMIPPTYREDTRLGDGIREELLAFLPELRGNLVPAMHGRKAIAARLGLTAYGVNNITYSPGLGSFLWIGVYATTARLAASARQLMSTESILSDCESCGRCRDACPTGAIAHERFLLKAERCLTCWNELPHALPTWIAAGAHNCLVGCMACQEVCPQNEGLLKVEDTGVVFDRAGNRGAPGRRRSVRLAHRPRHPRQADRARHRRLPRGHRTEPGAAGGTGLTRGAGVIPAFQRPGR